MYINDTHIMYYAVVAILGLFVGMFVDWMNSRLPEYKKVFIPKDKIEDIYITNRNHMKIKLKDYEIKKSFRAFIWTILKNIFLGANPNNVFRINLNFIHLLNT